MIELWRGVAKNRNVFAKRFHSFFAPDKCFWGQTAFHLQEINTTIDFITRYTDLKYNCQQCLLRMTTKSSSPSLSNLLQVSAKILVSSCLRANIGGQSAGTFAVQWKHSSSWSIECLATSVLILRAAIGSSCCMLILNHMRRLRCQIPKSESVSIFLPDTIERPQDWVQKDQTLLAKLCRLSQVYSSQGRRFCSMSSGNYDASIRSSSLTHPQIQFYHAYRSLCPSAWCERWDEQRGKQSLEDAYQQTDNRPESGTFPTKLDPWLWERDGVGRNRIMELYDAMGPGKLHYKIASIVNAAF